MRSIIKGFVLGLGILSLASLSACVVRPRPTYYAPRPVYVAQPRPVQTVYVAQPQQQTVYVAQPQPTTVYVR